jgi:hypothetical protein
LVDEINPAPACHKNVFVSKVLGFWFISLLPEIPMMSIGMDPDTLGSLCFLSFESGSEGALDGLSRVIHPLAAGNALNVLPGIERMRATSLKHIPVTTLYMLLNDLVFSSRGMALGLGWVQFEIFHQCICELN